MPDATQEIAAGRDAAPPMRPALALLLILAVTLGTRLFMVADAQNVALDSTTHLSMARMLFSQAPAQVLRDFKYHPGYAFTVGAIATVSGASWPDGWIVVGHIVSILAAMIAVAAFYYVAANVFDRTIGLAATMLLAISPAFTQTSADVLSDAPALAMALVAIAAGFKAMQRCSKESWSSVAYAVAAGLFGGLGYLFRPEHLLASAIAACPILLAAGGSTGFGFREGTASKGCATRKKLPVIKLVGVATLVAATAAVVLPYAITIGAFTQKKSIQDFAVAPSGPMLASVISLPLPHGAIRVGDLWHSPLNVLLKLQESMGPVTFGLACVGLLAWIAAALPRRERRWPQALTSRPTPAGAMAIFAPSVVLTPVLLLLEYHHRGYVSARHLMIPAAMLIPLAGAGAVILAKLTMATFRGARGQSLDDRLKHLSASGASFALFLLILAASSVATRSMATLHREKGCYRQVGAAMAKNLGPGHYVLSPDGWMPFFAQCPPDEFASTSPMQPNLEPSQISAPDTLYAEASRGPRAYDYIAAGKEQLLACAGPGDPKARDAAERAVKTLESLADPKSSDPRFTLVPELMFKSKKETIWVFKVNHSHDRKD